MKVPQGYEYIGLLGQGGFKEAFFVKDAMTGQYVALKRFRPVPQDQLNKIAYKEGTTIEGLFKKDAMQTILKHPNILRSSWFFDDVGNFWIREELYEQTLADLLKSKGRLSASRILEYARTLADVFGYCACISVSEMATFIFVTSV